jgi:serpin B
MKRDKTLIAAAAMVFLLAFLPGTGRAAKSQEKADADQRAAVVGSSNDFAIKMYDEIRSRSGNLFFSPASIALALAMTYAGAAGQTAGEMRDVLGFTLEDDQVHAGFGELLRAIGKSKKGMTLLIASALWGQKGLVFLKPFLAVTKSRYGGGFKTLDFETKTQKAIKAINAWASGKTKKKIKELVTEADVTGGTRLVLTNAIYFKGAWKEKFDKKDTETEPFHVSADKTVDARMMHLRGETFRYVQGAGVSAIELPYKGEAASMFIFLPDKKDGLGDLEKDLNLATLKGWISKMSSKHMSDVAIPRFTLEDAFELSKTLAAMGMPTAFQDAADFSGMTDSERLKIAKVIHKSFCDVTEEGTVAAAATAVMMSGTGAAPAATTFIADHPFLFVIRENTTGAFLFVGRLADPS